VEELTASIAHEIRNPITAAQSLVQQMGEDPRAGENIEYAKVALEELDRVEKSVSHLLKFAREEEVRMSDMTMSDVIEAALETFQDRIATLGVEIRKELDVRGAMRGDPEKLRRVIINLFGNALDALEQAGTAEPRVEIQAGENLAGTEVWVRIRDNGPGMDPTKVDRIFKPFYTSKANGTGLGLAITKKLVDAHGGSIEAVSQPGQGAEFVLTFPKAGPAESGASA
jgi:signal transduction histidine kinase